MFQVDEQKASPNLPAGLRLIRVIAHASAKLVRGGKIVTFTAVVLHLRALQEET